MNKVSDILSLANDAIKQDIGAVLATVVHTQGSSYRKAGAMMIIREDGRTAGMISGGCLEPHIIKKAFWLTRDGSTVQVFQTGEYGSDADDSEASHNVVDRDFADDLELTFGLGCNGRVHVLFERLSSVSALIKRINDVRDSQQSALIATLIRSDRPNDHIGLHVDIEAYLNSSAFKTLNNDDESTAVIRTVEDHAIRQPVNKIFKDPILKQAVQTVATKDFITNKLGNKEAVFFKHHGFDGHDLNQGVQTEWLIRWIKPQTRLLICGAGNDVIPLVKLAKMQDWHVTVIDSRSHYATRSRFMQADKVMCVPLHDDETVIKLSKGAAVAVMSHSLTQDKARLKVLLAHPPLYLGQLGPKYRTERLVSEIKQAFQGDVSILDNGIKRLTYPIGYKLGGEGPEALALGIMAQLQTVMIKDRETVNNTSPSLNNVNDFNDDLKNDLLNNFDQQRTTFKHANKTI